MDNRHSLPKPSSFFASAFAVVLFASTAAFAYEPSLTMNAADRARLESCDQVKIRFGALGGSWQTVRSSETFAFSRSEAAPLRASLPRGGGMRVQAWDQSDYEVEVCKAAAGQDAASAQDMLDAVRIERHRGAISAEGPERNRWTVFLILRVPRGGSVDLETANGEIGVRELDATVVARSQNGPIDLKNCSGDVRAHTENGPIAVSGGSGKHQLSTQNGPVAVALKGRTWKGEGLSAETVNGPIALTLHPDYATGVRVQSTMGSPWVCSGRGCRDAKRDRRNGHRSLVFGNTEPIIHLETSNGPVAIESPSDGDGA